LNNGLTSRFIGPGHALDQLSLSSHPEVLLNSQQTQRLPPQIDTHPTLATPSHQPASTSGNLLRKCGLSVTQRMAQAQAIETRLIELGEDPVVIRQVVAPLKRQRFEDI